jgi:hypothetical protein
MATSSANIPAGNAPFVDGNGILTTNGRNLLVALLKETPGTTLNLPKTTPVGVAPGAGNSFLQVVAGTTAGTAKLIMYAGTSAVPSVIIDNVGGGF